MKKLYLIAAGILFFGLANLSVGAFCIPDIDDKGGCYLPTNTACKELGTYRPCEAEKPAPKPTPIPLPTPEPAPVSEPAPAPTQTRTRTETKASEAEMLTQEFQAVEQKLNDLASSGKSIEGWQKEFNKLEERVKTSKNPELLKKLDELKAKAKEARGKRLFRPLFGPIKFRDILKNPIKKFRPWLRGGIADAGVSLHGYPNLNYISGYTTATAERIEIREEADGNVYLVNLNKSDAFAIFEGFGVYAGETIELPPINPTTFMGSGSGKRQESKAPAPSGTYSGEVKGAEAWAETKVTSVTDSQTGTPSLVTQFKVKEAIAQPAVQGSDSVVPTSAESAVERIPAGMKDINLLIKKDGKVIKQIPLVADVQEVLQPERNLFWLLMAALGLVGLFIGVRIALK